MTGLDTNVLVRYVVKDNPDQVRRAIRFIEDSRRHPLFVTLVVLCETVWVLDSCYHRSREEIAGLIGDLLQVRQIAVEDPPLVRRALDAYSAGRGDLADYIIRERAGTEGCEEVGTFDRDLLREEGFIEP